MSEALAPNLPYNPTHGGLRAAALAGALSMAALPAFAWLVTESSDASNLQAQQTEQLKTRAAAEQADHNLVLEAAKIGETCLSTLTPYMPGGTFGNGSSVGYYFTETLGDTKAP